MTFESKVWSRREFQNEARCFAQRFRSLGVQPGDRIIVMLENSPALLISVFASHQLGSIVVPLNPRSGDGEREYVIAHSEPKLLISEAAVPVPRGALNLTRQDVSGGFLQASVGATGEPDGARTLSPVQPGALTGTAEEPGGPESELPAFLIYTSGTTSRPKGVLLTHGNVMACLESLREAWELTAQDRLLLALPLFHVHGLIVGAHSCAWNGSEIFLRRGFDASDAWREILEHRCTLFMGVPTMYQRMLRHGTSSDAERAFCRAASESVRLFISGSAPLAAHTNLAFQQAFGQAILERYGMTEGLMLISNPASGPRKPGSVGLPLPGVSARLVDDSGQEASGDNLGEIWVRGASLFHEYWRNPEATRAGFADGWFKTGDMAHRDQDGYFFIAGRKSLDIIKCYGYKISALEIEDALLGLRGVQEAAVLGTPHPDKGEEILAFVRVDVDGPATSASIDATQLGALLNLEVTAFLDSRLARYKHPSRYVLVEALPRNPMGKVSKIELKALLSGDPG